MARLYTESNMLIILPPPLVKEGLGEIEHRNDVLICATIKSCTM